MEGDRKAFSEEVSIKLSKQRRTIRSLKEEHKNLKLQLKVANCKTHKQDDAKATSAFENLIDRHDELVDMIEKRKSHLEELNQQIKKLEKKVFELRKNKISDETCKARVTSGKSAIAVLENKLETAIKRFCTILNENRRLREDIDHLLKERAAFNERWQKQLTKLNQGKKFMLDLIEQAIVAYDQREEWCCKLQALKARAKNDLLIHQEEMKELQRRLDHDYKLHVFLGKKGQIRLVQDAEEKDAKKKEVQREKLNRELEKYKETVEKIKEFTGEPDMHRLAQKYIRKEEENFALFSYVNDVNREIERIRDNITKMEHQIEDQKTRNEERVKQQQEKLDGLDFELDEAIDKVASEKIKFDAAENKLRSILEGIVCLFKIISCDTTPLLELLGSHGPVNDYNVMVYMGLLEKKVTELRTCLYLKEKAHDKKRIRRGRVKKEDKDGQKTNISLLYSQIF